MGRIRNQVLCVLVLAAMFVLGRGVWPGKDILWAQDGTTVQTTEAVEVPREDATAQATETAETADLRAETAEVSDGGAEESVDASENLPASFVYTGEDPYMPAVCRWMEEELGKNYTSGEIFVPAPVVYFEDDTSPEDIRIWGNFWVFRYSLQDTVLFCESGGAQPGILHLRAIDDAAAVEDAAAVDAVVVVEDAAAVNATAEDVTAAAEDITAVDAGTNTGESYEVIGFEAAEEGTDFEESLRKLFEKAPKEAGDLYETYCQADSVGRNENVRKKFLMMYVAESPQKITAYQDFGWDPVPLDVAAEETSSSPAEEESTTSDPN